MTEVSNEQEGDWLNFKRAKSDKFQFTNWQLFLESSGFNSSKQ